MSDFDRDDLGVRARRGLLSRSEQRDLERAADSSSSFRIGYELGRDLDALTKVRGGDDALIASAAAAALARVDSTAGSDSSVSAGVAIRRRAGSAGGDGSARDPVGAGYDGAVSHRRQHARRRKTAAAFLTLGILAAAGAAAALFSGVVTWRPPFGSDAAAPPSAARSQARRAPELAVLPAVTSPAPVVEVAPPAATRELSSPPAVAEAASHASVRTRRKGAAELFHAANSARRDGALARAATLYADLRSKYPASAESELARVSLGQLLLARDDAAAAEREFRGYLARDRGQLVEEALLGRAQSLERLGRAREERATLQRLLDQFPHSVYAARAQARLRALESR